MALVQKFARDQTARYGELPNRHTSAIAVQYDAFALTARQPCAVAFHRSRLFWANTDTAFTKGAIGSSPGTLQGISHVAHPPGRSIARSTQESAFRGPLSGSDRCRPGSAAGQLHHL